MACIALASFTHALRVRHVGLQNKWVALRLRVLHTRSGCGTLGCRINGLHCACNEYTRAHPGTPLRGALAWSFELLKVNEVVPHFFRGHRVKQSEHARQQGSIVTAPELLGHDDAGVM